MNPEDFPPFSTDINESIRVFLMMAACDGVKDAAAVELLRVGFKSGASWAFTVASKDAAARADQAMHKLRKHHDETKAAREA